MATLQKTDQYIRLTSENYSLHPAFFNAIDRISKTYVELFCFDEYIDQDDYDFFSQVGIKNLKKGYERHTTLVNTTRFPIPKISHAVSMTALFNSEETIPLLEETGLRKVFFVFCNKDVADPKERFKTPYKNTKSYPVSLYSRDMEAFVWTRQTLGDTWAYDYDESQRVNDSITDIFAYNEQQVVVETGKKLLVICKPMVCTGDVHPRGIPCVNRYQWQANPVLIEQGLKIINDDYSLRRKVEDEYSAKEIFLLDPQKQYAPKKFDFHDKFGTPYGVDLLLIYNGKMPVSDTLENTIKVLLNGLDLLEQEVTLGENSDIIKYDNDEEDNYLKLTIPKDVNINLEETKYKIVIDDSILHMVTIKAMELIDDIYRDNLRHWTTTNISYKIPHRLIAQAELNVKLSQGSAIPKDILLMSINECRNTLSSIYDESREK